MNMAAPRIPDAVTILQALVRENTTNPPGNEAACIDYLNGVFVNAGMQPHILARDFRRPNLVVRLRGRGEAPPLLIQGHVDVVTTEGQDWACDPFCGDIIGGEVWGRGTLDDKGSVAMMAAAVLKLHEQKIELPGDVIFAAVADEEVGGEYGARFLVEEHADLFDGVKYAIGEGGGPSIWMAGRKLYPIMVAEKQMCSVRLTITGKPGHGAMPLRGEAMARLSDVLRTLDRKQLPVHVQPAVKGMINAIAEGLSFPASMIFRAASLPALTNTILGLLGDQAALLAPILHNTVSPTKIEASQKINVIPGRITVDLDGRLLPGYGPDDMLRELTALLREDVDVQVTRYEQGPDTADMRGYDVLADVIQSHDRDGTPFPYLLSGVTDARHFAKLGIQSYGFTPVQIPPGYVSTIHGIDERVPVEGYLWGCTVFEDALTRFWF